MFPIYEFLVFIRNMNMEVLKYSELFKDNIYTFLTYISQLKQVDQTIFYEGPITCKPCNGQVPPSNLSQL